MKCRTCGQEIQLSQGELDKNIQRLANRVTYWKTQLEEARGERVPKKTVYGGEGLLYILDSLQKTGKTQSELARTTFRSKSTVSRGVSKLLEQGKIRKDNNNKFWLV